MGFKEVTPVIAASSSTTCVKFKIVTAKKNTQICAGLTVPMTIMVEADLNEGDQFRLLVGEGPDSGTIRLMKDHKGPLTLKVLNFAKGARVGAIKLGDFEGLPRSKIAPVAVKHALVDKGFEVRIPALASAVRSQLPVMR